MSLCPCRCLSLLFRSLVLTWSSSRDRWSGGASHEQRLDEGQIRARRCGGDARRCHALPCCVHAPAHSIRNMVTHRSHAQQQQHTHALPLTHAPARRLRRSSLLAMSRPAPLVSRRPLAGGPVVTGGTSLGTPLKTRTVVTTVQAEAAMAAAAAGGPSTPARARAAPASSPLAARTPAKTPLRGFGSSVASTTVAAASSSSAAAAPAASPAASSVRRPSPSPKMISRQRYDANKTKDPFSAKTKFKTAFGEAYASQSKQLGADEPTRMADCALSGRV